MNVTPKDLKEVKSEKAEAPKEKIDETKKADKQMDLEIEGRAEFEFQFELLDCN